MRVCTVAQMRALDAEAIERLGIPELLLMENAGHAAVSVMQRVTGGLRGRVAAVLCGPGNNGGDGLVVARLAHSLGAVVRVHIVGDGAAYRGAAKVSYEAASRLGLLPGGGGPGLAEALEGADVAVDALFGTGLSRPPEGAALEAIRAVNRARDRALVVSLDIPSGVHGDTGALVGEAVMAHHTVTFGLPKLGNLLYPGHAHCGQLWVSPISFPPELRERPAAAGVSEPPVLPARTPDGHKGSYGDALFVAGSRSYLGAPVFAALAHLKAGGGYARLATPASLATPLAAMAPEVVLLPQPETESGSLSAGSLDALVAASSRADVTVAGPGLSLDAGAGELTRELTRRVARPLILDGDALTHLAADPGAAGERRAPLVLTPHPGELARLVGRPLDWVLASRLESLALAVKTYNAIVVSKGAHTLIGLPDGSVWINLSGNSGMATPGSGDVLTGAITAMYGLGLDLADAVRAGVFVHGLAGDLAAREIGKDGLVATDIATRLPAAVRELRDNREVLWADSYGKLRTIL